MARARNIKPGFFTNDLLAEVHPLGRILFAGLWTISDRAGRLEDRPNKIKAEVLPYDRCDPNKLLAELDARSFIKRYKVNGVGFIQIIAWDKHQNPHMKEAESTIPAWCENSASTVPDTERAGEIPERAGLIPSSLIPDSLNLIPDSGFRIPDPLQKPKTVAVGVENPTPPLPKAMNGHGHKPPKTAPVWDAYSTAYLDRYGTEPVRNAKANGVLSAFVDRLGSDEAPAVAAFYVRHNKAFYVGANHPLSALLQDCEGLRTQWATGQQVTATGAMLADRTQTNLNAWAPLIAAAKAKENADA